MSADTKVSELQEYLEESEVFKKADKDDFKRVYHQDDDEWINLFVSIIGREEYPLARFDAKIDGKWWYFETMVYSPKELTAFARRSENFIVDWINDN